MIKYGNLILFAGGDGTALDILQVVGDAFPILGIPSGVKMHSGLFAINPTLAGWLRISFLKEQIKTKKMEVIDYDAKGDLKLFGYALVPYDEHSIQGAKGYVPAEEGDEEAIATDIIESVAEGYAYIIGPDITAKSVMESLGLPYTLLGVDVIRNGRFITQDANEKQLFGVVEQFPSKILLGIIGGQGFLLGPGKSANQSFRDTEGWKEESNRRCNRAENSFASCRPLLVDTGDVELDRDLTGYVKITTGYRRSAVYRIPQSPRPTVAFLIGLLKSLSTIYTESRAEFSLKPTLCAKPNRKCLVSRRI